LIGARFSHPFRDSRTSPNTTDFTPEEMHRRPQSDVRVLKLLGSETTQRLDDFALEEQGAYGQLWQGETRAVDDGHWQHG